MMALDAFLRGIRAAVRPKALAAVLWLYAFSLGMTAFFAVPLFIYVSSTASGSVVADDLRHGLAPDWLIDQVATPGAGTAISILGVLAVIALPIHLLTSIFAAGGAIDAVLRALGAPPPSGTGRFLEAAGATFWRFLGLALLEAIPLGVLAVLFAFASAPLRGWHAWAGLVAFVVVVSVIVATFDLARVAVVEGARGVGGAASAAFEVVLSAPLSLVAVVLLNLALAGLVLVAGLALHGEIPKESGSGVMAALLVGQASMLVRLWARVSAFAAISALFLRGGTAR